MKRLNELERDDVWQRGIAERLLKPVLRKHAFEGQMYFFGCSSPISKLLQKCAHVDAMIPLSSGGDLSLELKIVRWPGVKRGRPHATGYSHFFLETWSSSLPGKEAQGWMYTCIADWLLYCFCSAHENAVDCFPFPMQALRLWFFPREKEFRESRVQNPINGQCLWSIGRLVPRIKTCRELKVDGFQVTDQGLVCDLFGKPHLSFMKQAPEHQWQTNEGVSHKWHVQH
jgi:hypothetical protein